MRQRVRDGLFRDGIYLAGIVVIEILWLIRNQIGILTDYESSWFIVFTVIAAVSSLLLVVLVMYLIRELEDIFVEVRYYYYGVLVFTILSAYIKIYHSFNYDTGLQRSFLDWINILHFSYILFIVVVTILILVNEDIRRYIKIPVAVMTLMTILSTQVVSHVVLNVLDYNVGMSAKLLQAYDTSILIIDYVIIVCTITIIYFCDKE